jgi:Fic family protein
MNFDEIDTLKSEWDTLQPLSSTDERRLWKKLSLEWNYHSNRIEGNTLTYGETELLLLHGTASGGHQLRDYEEMKAHDVAISHVRLLAEDLTRPMTEADIRDLNKIILKEPYWKTAETAEGVPTRKRIVPGQYKTTSNSVRMSNGEIFEFASPEDTPMEMDRLANWVRSELAALTMHPIAFGADLHHRFVRIHPFDDGNGRVARLLVNYILLRLGYPPLVVRAQDREAYLAALRLADAGDLSILIEYLAKWLKWSLALGIRAAKGESIEDLSEIEKEIDLFIRVREARENRMEFRKAERDRYIEDLLRITIVPFFETIESKLSKFKRLFKTTYVALNVDHDGGYTHFESEQLSEISEKLLQAKGVEWANVVFRFSQYKEDAPKSFDMDSLVAVVFDDDRYRLLHYENEIASHSFQDPISQEEADRLISNILKDFFAIVKEKSGSGLE